MGNIYGEEVVTEPRGHEIEWPSEPTDRDYLPKGEYFY